MGKEGAEHWELEPEIRMLTGCPQIRSTEVSYVEDGKTLSDCYGGCCLGGMAED